MSAHKVVEIFSSINGEGPKAGQLALFIRLQGCNLKCSYCDTKWANEDDAKFHWTQTEEIIDLIRTMDIKNVTLTGGEPLNGENVNELIDAIISETDCFLEIETNGSVYIGDFRNGDAGDRLAFTIDYKLPGSGMEKAMCDKNYQELKSQDSVKFVSSSYEDLLRAAEIIEEYELQGKCHIFISPVFEQIDPEVIVTFMKTRRLNDVNLQLQIHKFIWDSNMRGV